MPIKSGFGSWLRPVEAKTADYTVTAMDAGKIFTNRGAAGTVNFTLPKSSSEMNGWYIDVYGAANQTVTLTSNPADTLTVFNDLTADTWSLATSGAIIGSGATVFCDGTAMCVVPHNGGTDAATPLQARNTLTT